MLPKKLSNISNSTPSGATKKTASARKVLVVAALQATAVIVITGFSLAWWRDDRVQLHIGTARIQAELAGTDQERRKGLSGRSQLGDSQGMLLVFGADARWEIWMKDMRVPIDIVWLDANKKVVAVEHAVQPSSYPRRFKPPAAARYVVELASGVAAKNHIALGIVAYFDVPATTK